LYFVQSPLPGLYALDDWAAEIETNINAALAIPAAVISTVVLSPNPPTLKFEITDPTSTFKLDFDPSNAIAPYFGITPARNQVIGNQNPQFNGPLFTFPPAAFAEDVLHSFTVPEGTYSITELVAALNAVPAPFPLILPAVFAFTNNRVVISSGEVAQFRVQSVIENRSSTLAPLIGFQYDQAAATTQIADTAPGLSGLTNAYIHIRPVASLSTVAVSSGDGRALQVSVVGQIPLDGVGFGLYTQHDFSKSGETFLMIYEDDRDISRFQVRLRDHAGRLIELGNPGLVLMLKVFLR
jgi:hypothetical protein